MVLKTLKKGFESLKKERAAGKTVKKAKVVRAKKIEEIQLDAEAKKLSTKLDISIDAARTYIVAEKRKAMRKKQAKEAKQEIKKAGKEIKKAGKTATKVGKKVLKISKSLSKETKQKKGKKRTKKGSIESFDPTKYL